MFNQLSQVLKRSVKNRFTKRSILKMCNPLRFLDKKKKLINQKFRISYHIKTTLDDNQIQWNPLIKKLNCNSRRSNHLSKNNLLLIKRNKRALKIKKINNFLNKQQNLIQFRPRKYLKPVRCNNLGLKIILISI